MQDILQAIIDTKREELERLYAPKPSLRGALLHSSTGIIAEFKRKSPSKGWIKEDGQADVIPLSYQQNGAAALSILTDEHYFGGSDDFIRQARHSGVTLPILYKNFVVDEAQVFAAALCGASAVLLIAACLSKQECKRLMNWDSRCCWRCTRSRNWNMPTSDPTSVASIIAISARLSLMSKTVSVWLNCCLRMP